MHLPFKILMYGSQVSFWSKINPTSFTDWRIGISEFLVVGIGFVHHRITTEIRSKWGEARTI